MSNRPRDRALLYAFTYRTSPVIHKQAGSVLWLNNMFVTFRSCIPLCMDYERVVISGMLRVFCALRQKLFIFDNK